MITGNKGEWSEPYLLLKLLAEQKLFIGKENFEKVEDIFYPIIKIIHHEKSYNSEFSFDGDIVVVKSKEQSFRIPVRKFLELSKVCLNHINEVKSRNGSFSIPEIEYFLNSINITSIKSKATNKSDITIQIEDPNTIFSQILGFSIKSQLGKSSTLLNASKQTDFTYQLSQNISDKQIQRLNSLKKFSDKFQLLNDLGIEVKFEKVDSPVFNLNLQTIDYNFPKILSEIVLLYYKNNNSKKNTVRNFTKIISNNNEFGYDLTLNSEIYEMIVKRFLVEYALGMRAGEVWKRDYQANGGYLVIREDGEILCYHFYFIKNFENYLFENTKLETPSSKRYKMAEIYEENGVQKLKLNLQIRFIK
ncbi:HpaII family restriction endonuclease [Weeksellaceae bacterium TAE3-ERU29]|nr:HpaII family restriction endonuclease [Weeksellaceae bacterium TAE3-ERU29]